MAKAKDFVPASGSDENGGTRGIGRLGKIGGDGGIVDVGDIADAGAGFDFFGLAARASEPGAPFSQSGREAGGSAAEQGRGTSVRKKARRLVERSVGIFMRECDTAVPGRFEMRKGAGKHDVPGRTIWSMDVKSHEIRAGVFTRFPNTPRRKATPGRYGIPGRHRRCRR
jgi:hypothetical protein